MTGKNDTHIFLLPLGSVVTFTKLQGIVRADTAFERL